MFKYIFIYSLLIKFLFPSSFVAPINDFTKKTSDTFLFPLTPMQGLITDHLIADGLITLWGFKNWKWNTESFSFKTEDWFEENSATGGSDKASHFFMTYLISRMLSSRMEDRGLDLKSSSLLGSLSGMLAMSLLETGDATSPYGFSKEDLLADGLGAISAYFIRTNPFLDDIIDIRVEYFPTTNYLNNPEAAADYSGMKHLLAFKFSGIEKLEKTSLRYFELQLGYYARGYRTYDIGIAKSQQIYVGLGLNLTQFSKEIHIHFLQNLWEFYQPRFTYVEAKIWKR